MSALLSAFSFLCVAMPAPASAAEGGITATCGGQTATIVGTPGQDFLAGTQGADVIVSNGAENVYADTGADLVCLTNGDAKVELDGVQEYDDTGSWAVDRIIGTDGDDEIISGFGVDEFYDLDQAEENGDSFDLGSGESTVRMSGVPAGSIDGGSGRDRLYLYSRGTTLTVGAATSLQVAGHGNAPLAGIESFHLEETNLRTINFTGTAAAESVYAKPLNDPFYGSAPDTVIADLGAGDDTIAVPPAIDGSIKGGPGDDQFAYASTVGPSRQIIVNLDNGAVKATLLKAGVVSFGRLVATFPFRSVTVVGDARANQINATGCTVRVEGAAGNDRIAINSQARCGINTHVVEGGAGDDSIVGTQLRDELLGGPGRDVINGRAKSDRCVAEVRRHCER